MSTMITRILDIRFTKSIFIDLLLWMLGFGVFMGLVFPPFTWLILDLDQSQVFSITFVASCIAAGSIVGLINYGLVKHVIGDRFELLIGRMRRIQGYLSDKDRVGQCAGEECFVHIQSNDVIGDTAASFNALIEALRQRTLFEGQMWNFIQLMNKHIELPGLIVSIIREFCKISAIEAGLCMTLQREEWEILESYGIDRDLIDSEKLCKDGGLLQRCMQSHKTITIDVPADVPIEIGLPGLRMRPRQMILHPVVYHNEVLGVFIFLALSPVSAETHSIMQATFSQLANAFQNSLLYERVKKISVVDELTGAYNRRFGMKRLREELSRADRMQDHMAVVMVDLDHFKSVNDTYGHPAGDAVLREVAQIFNHHIRQGDLMCRYGGEEFLLIFIGASQENAVDLAERLRKMIELHEVKWHDNVVIKITASFGISVYPQSQGIDDMELIRQADEALYNAKNGGRNQIKVY
ncbi:MAG: sensor domain-containing diguanylate cyclase [Leptospiraceae bacterium]|nr:sensor domain-containing diguanylate cyclase [Leptospiraceae bacterium]